MKGEVIFPEEAGENYVNVAIADIKSFPASVLHQKSVIALLYQTLAFERVGKSNNDREDFLYPELYTGQSGQSSLGQPAAINNPVFPHP